MEMFKKKKWPGFVNNNPTSAQKLLLIIFGCGWLGEKIGHFFQVRPVCLGRNH